MGRRMSRERRGGMAAGLVRPAPVGHDAIMSRTSALLTVEQMSEADRLTIAGGKPGIELMEQAGRAVAETVMERLSPSDGTIAVYCGPGNNGGDGFIAARLLHRAGYPVVLGLLGPRSALKGDAAEAERRWGRACGSLFAIELAEVAGVVDALFGAGLARDLDGEARTIVERINLWSRETGRPVFAVDVPSGLDGDSGQVRGVAISATQTVTFFRRKPGHLLLPGRILCGETEAEDIGIGDAVLESIQPQAFVNEPALWQGEWPRPGIAGHKYSRGHALVLSGSAWHTGAARLAARGALRAGAGLVTMASPGDALAVHAAHLTSIMLTPSDGSEGLREALADGRRNVLVMGPGLGVGAETRALVAAALSAKAGEYGRSFVLDADALTSFADASADLRDLIAAAPGPVVLTPHDGEFQRLFKDLRRESQASRKVSQTAHEEPPSSKLTRTRNAAAWSGAVVVLKGADTVVAMPDGRASISGESAPWLATAGSGDVLAGMIGGLLAQGMPAFAAASAAVWLHARAAVRFGPGLISEDIPEALPGVFADLIDKIDGGEN
jgi:hydroxyethylthiazole kinase-like uncharacterized protein yjeF